ncbi:MAG: restriction endonuclease subunit S, partial [Acidimicrobiia bacterium]|nr:restriction endonuclease subunit S [Acidimicrobiia bacterium]
MTGDKPLSLMPKLRFPEFRDLPEWDLLTLSSASDVNPKNDGLPERFIYIDLESVKNGILVERKWITRDAAPSRAQRLLSRKEIIYQTVRPYQRNNLFFDVNDGNVYVASTGYAQLRAHECPEFLCQLIHTDSFVDNVLARCAGSNYPAIKSSDLASIEVALPRQTEQQRIADCLSSLDDLIESENRKLEALQQHRRGLMQQLFPQPGETVPRLRFKECSDVDIWRYVPRGSLGLREPEDGVSA